MKNYFIMTVNHLEKKRGESEGEASLKESMESLHIFLPSCVEYSKSDHGSFSSAVWALVSSVILGPIHTDLFSFLPLYKSKKAKMSGLLTQHISPNFPVFITGFLCCLFT